VEFFCALFFTLNSCDSGIFVMKLMQSHNGDKQHLFKPEDAKPLQECISYYLLTHACNEKYNTLVDIKKILTMPGVTIGFYQ